MGKESDFRNRVIQDERDATKAHKKFLAHIEQAQIELRNIADNKAVEEGKRAAAAEAETALRKVEEARLRAEREAQPEAVKKTFWGWFTN